MENKKTPITHELILYRFKRSIFGFIDPKVLPFVIVLLGIVLIGPYYFLTQHKATTPISYGTYLCIMGICVLLVALYTYHQYKQIKSKKYQVVTDHLKRKYNPVFEPLRYRHVSDDHTRFYEFRKYGKCPAYDWSIQKHRSQIEGEIHYNYHHSEIGDKFYLVMLGKRIMQVYSDRSYYLPEETEK